MKARRNRKLYSRKRGTKSKKRPWLKRLFWGSALLVAVVVVANGVMWLVYRERVLPNYSLGSLEVGNVSYGDLGSRIDQGELLPAAVTLQKDGKKQEVATKSLGISVDKQASAEDLREGRNLFPLLSLITQNTVSASIKVNQQTLDEASSKLAKDFRKEPLPERIIFDGNSFAESEPRAGYELDEAAFQRLLLSKMRGGQSTVQVPTKTLRPPNSSADLESELNELNSQLNANIKFRYGDQTATPSKSDMGKWFESDGQTMKVSASLISDYAEETAQKFGVSAYNAGDAAQAALLGLATGQEVDFVLAAQSAPVKYTYCAQLKGVNQSHKTRFVRKAAAVLGDPRGWNAGGQVAFERVNSGCDFTLWLSTPSFMTSFGGVCDPFWSCRSGRNVVINFDRWQGATDAWNNNGGNLQNYRVMVTNHEVGHWLGFGHRSCPGSGQLAPVMMQQSMDLKGCKFNPWPVESELDTLEQSRGVAALPARDDLLAAEPCCCAGCTGHAA